MVRKLSWCSLRHTQVIISIAYSKIPTFLNFANVYYVDVTDEENCYDESDVNPLSSNYVRGYCIN